MTERQELYDRVGSALVALLHRVEDSKEAAARNQGMHQTDLRCLGYLASQDRAVSPRDVISTLSITSGACTALLDRLEASRFIQRIPNPEDRRSVLIQLDRDAARKPLALLEQMQKSYYQATRPFSPENLEAIALYLEQVANLTEELSKELYGNSP
jgi:DNA-binding MarR family transcriptional regulator